ncbi:P-type conjugative transfer protein TrbL [Desulfobacter curvatus]|uniref:P-type conjugative transfer protein TrbL n=1 Tax=Desulfobacter curvatus TaxID=2290 RepID=UPI00146E7AF0|nr:P-type conjugative transfer protein TrbL [Desulfobacter curvatus]
MIKFLDIKTTPVKICLYLLMIAGSLSFFNELAIATEINQDIIEIITNKYKLVGSTWGENIKSHALWLLKWLLVIQLIVMAVKLGFKQSTLQDVVEDLVMTAIFGGIFWALIIKGQAWGVDLIQGMLKMAKDVAGGGSPPGEAFFAQIFKDTLTIADNMVYSWNPAKIPALGLAAIVSAICGAFIYGMYLVVLCESYIAFNLGIFILGFGGMRYSRSFATGFLKYVLSVGLKLFVIRCLLYILGTFLAEMVFYNFKAFTEVLVITACLCILAFLIKVLPDTIARMVTLHSGSSAGAITGAMAAGAGMAASAASMGVGAAAGAAGGGGMAGALSGARSGALEAIAKAVKPKEEK